jgi:hypothetical protein
MDIVLDQDRRDNSQPKLIMGSSTFGLPASYFSQRPHSVLSVVSLKVVTTSLVLGHSAQRSGK